MRGGELRGARCPFHRDRLRYDAGFALEVRWCADRGVPHSTLLEWTPEDRAKLIAHLLEEAQRCQMCGTAPWEWEEDPHAYEATMITCMGCYRKEVMSEDQEKSPGTRMTLVPRAKAERMAQKPVRNPRRQ